MRIGVLCSGLVEGFCRFWRAIPGDAGGRVSGERKQPFEGGCQERDKWLFDENIVSILANLRVAFVP